jgi:hydrogen peroxide-dependent heme synthase
VPDGDPRGAAEAGRALKGGDPSPGSAPPPETVEGHYVLHQLFSVDRPMLRGIDVKTQSYLARESLGVLQGLERPLPPVAPAATAESRGGSTADGGWSAVIDLIGSRADVMFVHLRPTLDEIGVAQRRLSEMPLHDFLQPAYSFLSVTEAGMYHITAKVAREIAERGGEVGGKEYDALLAERVEKERATEHVRKRLYPELPEGMPYVCFYPMSKKREAGANWYALSLEERSRLMQEHGASGRRYAGRVTQVVSGAIGLDAWEWGVTLFARDPLDFKKIVSEMRFDEASAKYGEFGEFFVGKVVSPSAWLDGL